MEHADAELVQASATRDVSPSHRRNIRLGPWALSLAALAACGIGVEAPQTERIAAGLASDGGTACTLEGATTAGLQGDCAPGQWCNLDTGSCQSEYLPAGVAIPLPAGKHGCSGVAALSACSSGSCNAAGTLCGCQIDQDCAPGKTCDQGSFDCVGPAGGGPDAAADAGSGADAGSVTDASSVTETGSATDAGSGADAGSVTDAGLATDASSVTDAGPATDAGDSDAAAPKTLMVSPAAISVPPLGTQTFTATGGSGTGYTFSLQDTSSSGGSIDATTGAYKAGARGNTTDSVRVTDSLGHVAVAQITVAAALTVTPTAATLPPRGKQQLTAKGGSGVYTWKLLGSSGSGGSVDADGLYTAGPTGVTTDTIVVADSLGATANAAFVITVGLSLSPTVLEAVASTEYRFTASGGSGVYTWALTTNASGGAVDASGNYTAGKTGRTQDVVTVTDSVGNTTSATINVAPVPVRAQGFGFGCAVAEGEISLGALVFGAGLVWAGRRRKRPAR
jgi:hypothetical protein